MVEFIGHMKYEEVQFLNSILRPLVSLFRRLFPFYRMQCLKLKLFYFNTAVMDKKGQLLHCSLSPPPSTQHPPNLVHLTPGVWGGPPPIFLIFFVGPGSRNWFPFFVLLAARACDAHSMLKHLFISFKLQQKFTECLIRNKVTSNSKFNEKTFYF